MQNLEEISFKIISFSGEAQSKMLEGLKAARETDYELAERLLEEGKSFLQKAHKVQTELIVGEARGEKTPYSILMVHAQDHLMTAMLCRDLAEEIVLLRREMATSQN